MFSSSTLIDTIFDKDATVNDLLNLVFALAIFWAIVFHLADLAIRPIVFDKPWLKAAGERDYEHNAKEMYHKLGISITKEDYLKQFTTIWPLNLTVALQHLIGGALCIPAVFKIGDPDVASSLACLGILSEMGWEIEDMVVWMFRRFVSKKCVMPDAMLIMSALHHTLTTTLGVPMILYYRNLYILHILTFELQVVGGFSLLVMEYTKILDITKKNQLNQFRFLTFLACVAMVFTRGFHWFYLSTKLIMVWYHDKNWVFLAVGAVLILTFSIFNYFFCITLFCKRFVKFMKISEKHNTLPANASETIRRRSEINVRTSASTILKYSYITEEEVSSLFEERKAGCKKTPSFSVSGSAQAIKIASQIMSRSFQGNGPLDLYGHMDVGEKTS